MLKALYLQTFRCFQSLELAFCPQGALFIGENAQGKTSLLEAICLLMRLHSPRENKLSKLIAFDQTSMALSGLWHTHRLTLRYQRSKDFTLSIDGQKYSRQRDYLSQTGLLVWMGNEDMMLVRGASRMRRRYLDFLASQFDPLYKLHLHYYSHALRARNILLKKKLSSPQEIDTYTHLLIEHGSILLKKRYALLPLLEKSFQESYAAISAARESIYLDYRASIKDDFALALEQSAPMERQRGMTLVGPHRDDLSIFLNQRPARDFASEGQQRSIALALKLAQGTLLANHHGSLPLYLLDDIFGELDISRRKALLEALPKAAQIFMTTTHTQWIDNENLPVPLLRMQDIKMQKKTMA